MPSHPAQQPTFDTVCEVPYHLLPRDVRLLTCTVPAGFPSPAADDLEEPIDLGAWLVEQPAASYVMRVSGWSMSTASIADGDFVVVSRAVEPAPGCIVVALVHGERTLKRLRRREGRLWLVPEAGDYPGGYVETLIDEDVEIWGVVVGLARKMPVVACRPRSR